MFKEFKTNDYQYTLTGGDKTQLFNANDLFIGVPGKHIRVRTVTEPYEVKRIVLKYAGSYMAACCDKKVVTILLKTINENAAIKYFNNLIKENTHD